MFASLLSASNFWIDIVFFAIVLICLAVGALGGISRALKGPFVIVSMVLFALLLTSSTATAMCDKTTGFRNMRDSMSKSITAWGEVYDMPVHIDEDGIYFVYTNEEERTGRVNLEDAAGSGLANKSKGKTAVWLAKHFIDDKHEGETLAYAAADMFTMIIVSIVTFIMWALILTAACFLLRILFKGFHNSGSTVIQVIDRVLGALIAATLAIIAMLMILAIMTPIGRIAPSINSFMSDSRVVGYIYYHNPMGNVLGRIFGK